MRKTIWIFGGICVVILLLFQLEQWSLFSLGISGNQYLIISGLLFLVLGIVVSKYFSVRAGARKKALRKSSLSAQELRVLQLVAEGHTNRAIAERLFIAETTVKSHVSNILVKLDAKRRTEAVKIGRDLEIIE